MIKKIQADEERSNTAEAGVREGEDPVE